MEFSPRTQALWTRCSSVEKLELSGEAGTLQRIWNSVEELQLSRGAGANWRS
jgi:hypothetical protein